MEKVFRKIADSGFTNEQIGQLLKMALCYLDAGQPQGTDQMLMAYFGNNIAKDIDRIKNDRIRKRKGNKNNEN